MNRFVNCIVVLGAVALFQGPSRADDFHRGHSRSYYHPGYAARAKHGRHHDDLEHRAYHRELDHRRAHRYPMSYRQHNALHDDLDHEAFHDHLEHRAAHATGAYYPRRYYSSPYSTGYGYYYSAPRPYYGSGFSLYIGR